MKILILHQHFKTPLSGGAIRSWYLAKGLVDNGHQAVVITSHNDKGYLHTEVDGIEVYYLPVPYDNSYNYFRRGVSFLRFVSECISTASGVKGVDCIYAISVPLTIAIAARWTSFRKKVPYYFEVGDLWPDAPIQMGFVKNPLMRSFLYSLERSTYKKAKGLVALSPSIKDAILKRAPNAKVHTIPNMADCDFYHPEKKQGEKLVVSYIGAVGLANGLDYFLECANAAKRADLPIHFVICGTGALLDRIKSSAKKLDLQNITFTGFVDREGVKNVMKTTDVVFVCYKDVPILETGSPNKFFDGLAAGKLIVINFGGWIKKEIEENKCGVAIARNDPADFVRKIRVFLTDPEWLRMHQEHSRELAMKKYERKKLVSAWLEIFKPSQGSGLQSRP